MPTARARPKPFYVSPPTLSLAGSDFNARRQTFIVTHGFMSNGNSSWVLDLKDAILGQVRANEKLKTGQVPWGGWGARCGLRVFRLVKLC